MVRFIVCILIISAYSSSLYGERYIDLYISSVESREHTKQLITSTQGKITKCSISQGYYGAAKILMAKHAINPINKLVYFKSGKAWLEKAIEVNPNSIELRYLRLTIQMSIPSFLNYKENIEEDRSYIQRNLTKVSDPTIQKLCIQIL